MAKRKESFLQGIIYLMFSQIIMKILGMVYSLYLTNKRGFGDEGNAICMAGFQVYALFLGICSFGVSNAISKMISESLEIGDEENCNKILKISLVLFTTIGFVLCLILYNGAEFIATKILSINASCDILKILAPSIVFSTVESVFRGYFNGINKISISAKSATIEQILKTIFTIIFVELIGNVTDFNTELMAKGSMLAASIATISSFLYSFIKYKKLNIVKYGINNKIKSSREILREMLSILIPISITSILMVMENNIDSITIVRLLKDKLGEIEARKIYGIITSKVNLLLNLPLALNGAISVSLIPEISRNIIKANNLKVEKSINFSILITLVISVPIMLGCMFYSEEVIKLLYPNAPKGADLLRLGSITIVISCITQNISGILQGIGNSKTHLFSVLIGMTVKLILNFILISNDKLLEKGAIISTLVSDTVIFTIMYRKLKKSFNIKFSICSDFVKIFGISICSIFIAENVFRKIIINFRIKFVLEILFLVIIYLIFLIVFKVLKNNKNAQKPLKMHKI